MLACSIGGVCFFVMEKGWFVLQKGDEMNHVRIGSWHLVAPIEGGLVYLSNGAGLQNRTGRRPCFLPLSRRN